MASFKNIIDSENPVLIDFYADWCGPCKSMPPILSKLKEEWKDKVTIIKIDVDKNQALAQRLNVRNIPTLMIYKKNELVYRKAGVHTFNQLKNILDEHVSSE